jgi:hypothetical protein
MATYSQPASFNKLSTGLIIGFILPFIFFLLYFLFRFKDISFGEYIRILVETGKIVHVISLSVFPNLIPFMLFIKTDRYRSGRGVLAATIVLGILIFILKFLA